MGLAMGSPHGQSAAAASCGHARWLSLAGVPGSGLQRLAMAAQAGRQPELRQGCTAGRTKAGLCSKALAALAGCGQQAAALTWNHSRYWREVVVVVLVEGG